MLEAIDMTPNTAPLAQSDVSFSNFDQAAVRYALGRNLRSDAITTLLVTNDKQRYNDDTTDIKQ